MREASKHWIRYTNSRKQHLDKAKEIESKAKSAPLAGIESKKELELPKFQGSSRVKLANIAYAVPVERVRALAEALGDKNMSYREVGSSSFEYAYNRKVGE